MMISMAVIVGLVVALLLLVPRPNMIPVRSLDVASAVSAGQTELGFIPVNPTLPEGWTARAANVQRDTDDLPTWHLTYTTPSGHYVGVQQTAKATAAWEARQVTDGPEQGSQTIGDHEWIVRSRLDRGITNLVLRQPPITTVVTGNAPAAEMTRFAQAVAP